MLALGITVCLVPAAWAGFILTAAVIESHDRRRPTGGSL